MLAGFVGIMRFTESTAPNFDPLHIKRVLVIPDGFHTVTGTMGALTIAAAAPYAAGMNTSKLLYSDNNLLFTGSGSVYNRDKLAGVLACDKSASDLDLMRLAWCRWGANSTSYLDGDWMFAAYDCRKKELVLARSWGYASLYYYINREFFAFATHPTSLSDLPDVPKEPDLISIAKILCYKPLASDTSFYKGIRQLQPASYITVADKEIKETKWWCPTKIKQNIGTDAKSAYNNFVPLFEKAVRKRLQTPIEVGATLSAGLDSSAVCILAAREFQLQGKDLHAWTAVPQYPEEAYSSPNWLTDESELANRTAKGVVNIRHQLVNAANTDPIDAIRRQVLITGRPTNAVANQYWIDKILAMASEVGCGTLLTGQMGNLTVSWSPAKISLFPKTKYFNSLSWPKYLHLIKCKGLALARKTKKRFFDFKPVTTSDMYSQLINPQFIQTDIFQSDINKTRRNQQLTRAEKLEVNMYLFDVWYHQSLWSGVEVRDPTMDVELTEFLFSVPDRLFLHEGIDRSFIRLGMKDIIPDEIRLNKKRGQQGSDILPRVRQFYKSAERALEIINDSVLAQQIINVPQMQRVLQDIITGGSGFAEWKKCTSVLLRGISIGLFLVTFDTDYDLKEPLEK